MPVVVDPFRLPVFHYRLQIWGPNRSCRIQASIVILAVFPTSHEFHCDNSHSSMCSDGCIYETITKVIPIGRKKNTFHSHVIAHSQRWGAPRLQVADILVLQFQALDSPGTAGTARHAENQSSEILHCIVVSYIRAYTSYLHVCIYRCTSSR